MGDLAVGSEIRWFLGSRETENIEEAIVYS